MRDILKLPDNLSALPTPDTEGEWKEFWEGTARGKLLIQSCPACSHRQFYPRAICTKCGEEPEWMQASGKGTIHTFSIIRQNLVAPFKEMLPYALAMIDLNEGVRMMANITDCAVDDVDIGMSVEVYMKEAKPGLFIPYWRPQNR